MTVPVLELHGVTKAYRGGVTALRDVELTVWPGEFVAIVGPSGSGKSTLLNIVGSLARPTVGEVRIAGTDVATLTDRRMSALRATTIGFIFQQFHVAPGRSALDNVADGLLYAGVRRKARRRRAADALDRVGLGHRTGHRPHELSGGERQRVAIARAIVGEPALLLADEPTGNLDSESGAGVQAVLQQLNRAGTTIVVITHNAELAAGLPRQIMVRDGRVSG
jgi:putative ABC transport system ATP-binding protein